MVEYDISGAVGGVDVSIYANYYDFNTTSNSTQLLTISDYDYYPFDYDTRLSTETSKTYNSSENFVSTNVSGERGSESSLFYDSCRVSFVALLAVVFLISIIGNFLSIFTILILKEYKTVFAHWLVLQLTFGNMLLLFAIPFRIAEELQQGWFLPQWICKTRETILFLNYYSSIWFLLLMVIDRYIAECHPLSANLKKFWKGIASPFTTIVIWFISLVMCVPVAVFTSEVRTSSNCKCELLGHDFHFGICDRDGSQRSALEFATCVSAVQACSKPDGEMLKESFFKETTNDYLCRYQYQSDVMKTLAGFNMVGMFLLPLMIMSGLSARIMLMQKQKSTGFPPEHEVLQHSDCGMSARTENTRSNSSRYHSQLMLMSLSMFLLFYACWLPFQAFQLIKLLGLAGDDGEYCEKLVRVSFIIAYLWVALHPMLNPILYNFIGINSESRVRSAISYARKSSKELNEAQPITMNLEQGGEEKLTNGYSRRYQK